MNLIIFHLHVVVVIRYSDCLIYFLFQGPQGPQGPVGFPGPKGPNVSSCCQTVSELAPSTTMLMLFMQAFQILIHT